MFLSKRINVAILGASGYTGVELIRLLLSHPHVHIHSLVADSNANKPIHDIYPHLTFYDLPPLVSLQDADLKSCDVVFCCLPHTTSQEVIQKLPSHLKIIDLSADFRLKDPLAYQEWYGHEHLATELQKEAVYGLSEIYPDDIKKANLIACPGCYPTSMLLPLAPLCQAKLIEPHSIIVDSKSGVTGAGRSAKQANLFCEVNENFKAYNIGIHRHTPEVEQILSLMYGQNITIHFSPHLVPMSRGILSTIYVDLAPNTKVTDLQSHLIDFYEESPFVQILPVGSVPSTRDVASTNFCHIGITAARYPGKAVIVSVIDNLIKGASGQAVQNMNLLFGFEQTDGLRFTPIFP